MKTIPSVFFFGPLFLVFPAHAHTWKITEHTECSAPQNYFVSTSSDSTPCHRFHASSDGSCRVASSANLYNCVAKCDASKECSGFAADEHQCMFFTGVLSLKPVSPLPVNDDVVGKGGDGLFGTGSTLGTSCFEKIASEEDVISRRMSGIEPTTVPTTSMPSLAPTASDTAIISLSWSMDASAPPSESDKDALERMVVQQIGPGHTIKNIVVHYTTRRRNLFAATWQITFDVVSTFDAAPTVKSSVIAALYNSAFTSDLQMAITSINHIDPLVALIMTRGPSSAPTSEPTSSALPTSLPSTTPRPTLTQSPTSPSPVPSVSPGPSGVPFPLPTPAPTLLPSVTLAPTSAPCPPGYFWAGTAACGADPTCPCAACAAGKYIPEAVAGQRQASATSCFDCPGFLARALTLYFVPFSSPQTT